ncbi:6626_t:CDS:2, partial [Diversispora eburnea]
IGISVLIEHNVFGQLIPISIDFGLIFHKPDLEIKEIILESKEPKYNKTCNIRAPQLSYKDIINSPFSSPHVLPVTTDHDAPPLTTRSNSSFDFDQ